MHEHLYIGTRGFDHDKWSGGFYDPDLPLEWRFQHYTNQLRSVLLPWDYLLSADADDFRMLRDDSDDDFHFALEVDMSRLEDFMSGMWPVNLEPIAHRVRAIQARMMEAGQGHPIDSLATGLKRLSTLAPVCLSGALPDGPGLAETAESCGISRTWYPQSQTLPQPGGHFLVVEVGAVPLPDLRATIEHAVAWMGQGRSAGIYFNDPDKGAECAVQGRLLAEMMGW